jgi:hypothetical protein
LVWSCGAAESSVRDSNPSMKDRRSDAVRRMGTPVALPKVEKNESVHTIAQKVEKRTRLVSCARF